MSTATSDNLLQITVRARILRQGRFFIAYWANHDICRQGETEEQALQNLREAIELYFEKQDPQAEAWDYPDAGPITDDELTFTAAQRALELDQARSSLQLP